MITPFSVSHSGGGPLAVFPSENFTAVSPLSKEACHFPYAATFLSKGEKRCQDPFPSSRKVIQKRVLTPFLLPFSPSPLTSFVLPGGQPAAAWCHLARTVCRRAEREVVTLTRSEVVNPQIVIYLNRLSDLLFVLARDQNDRGGADVLWVPGQGAGP